MSVRQAVGTPRCAVPLESLGAAQRFYLGLSLSYSSVWLRLTFSPDSPLMAQVCCACQNGNCKPGGGRPPRPASPCPPQRTPAVKSSPLQFSGFSVVPSRDIRAIRGSQAFHKTFRVTSRRILRTTSVKDETNQTKTKERSYYENETNRS